MRIELRITSGARAGAREVFEKSVISIGRHPLSDLRLDTAADLDVSGRHAEIRVVDRKVMVRDVGSSNGTKVNGQPLVGELALFDGDSIQLGGANGASLSVHLLADDAADPKPAPEVKAGVKPPVAAPPQGASPSPAPKKRDTVARIAEAVDIETGRLRRLLYLFGTAVVLVVLGLAWVGRRNADADRAIIDQLLKQLQDQNAAIAQLRGSAGARGLSDEVGRIRQERDSLLGALRTGGSAAAISGRIAALTQRQNAAGDVSKVDYERISEQNTRAMTFVVVQHADGSVEGGSGFGVTQDGLIITNRHVVEETPGGGAPAKLAVQFNGTGKWLPAHVLKTSTTHDLAFLKVDRPGTYPTVLGITSSGGVRAGAPIAIVGFPLGNETAGMGGSIDTMTARASLTAGFVSKSIPDILQVDAYVAHGSSGSPVFNQRGMVVGVVYGGPTAAAGRIVYSVPSDRVIAQLPGEAAGVVRP